MTRERIPDWMRLALRRVYDPVRDEEIPDKIKQAFAKLGAAK